MKPVLLGFSTHVSIVFDLLHDRGFRGRVSIVKNIPVEEASAPFETDGITVERHVLDEYQATDNDDFVLAVTDPKVKKLLVSELARVTGRELSAFPELIHSSALVGRNAVVGHASVIEQGVILAPYASVGSAVNIKRGANIGHHTVVEDYATVNPGVTVSGNCRIGAGSAIGVGCTLFDQLEIGAGSVISGGSVVTKSIPPGVLAYGNPCKVVREI